MKVYWKPGDSPRQHPLWRDQIALETEMVQRGADHYREMVAKARDPGAAKDKAGKYPPEMTRVIAYRREMVRITQDMGEGLSVWFKNHAKRPQNAPPGFSRMSGLDPYVIAFLTVRQIMDQASVQKLNLTSVARQIGLAVEQEHRMNAWVAEEPALWAEVQKGLKEQKATDDHRHKVNINRFNSLIRDKINWEDWGHDERIHVGLNAISVLCRVTKDIIVTDEEDEERTSGRGNGFKVVRLSEDLLKHIAKGLDRDETKTPYYMPTIMPPKRWDGIRNGGYYTKFVRVPWLVRFHADSEEVKFIAADEYDTLDMPKVYEAVRLVQETPWRVNQRVLAVALRVWDQDLGLGGITRREPRDLPVKTPALEKALKMVRDWERTNLKGLDMAARKEALDKAPPRIKKAREVTRVWKSEAAEVYGENARRISHTNTARQTIQLAVKFKDKEFYFPHMLDFRGRMYPIPMYLQPQGHDLARGLLTFAQAKPVKAEDAGWLAIHVANTWGNDKVSFDDRIQWVEENRAMWLRIAENPLGSLEWANRDDPWQCLAAILEWARYLCEGPGMLSSLPIRVDGTCNGIQHLASMMRDEVSGAEVNLVPSDYPKDIYGTMGTALYQRLEGIRESSGLPGQRADWWLSRFPEGIPRSLPKNPVMVLPYGGTRDSYFGSIHKWLTKNDPEGVTFGKDERRTMVPFMRDNLWDTVAGGEVMAKPMACMEWLKGVAEVVAETGQPIFWTTPAGFHVRHFYGAEKSTQIKSKVDGKAIWLRLTKRTKELSKRDQLQGISPNFVHSMDAAANMETILLFHETNKDDPPPFTTIHDAYGTVAGSMGSLYDCLREAFIRVHSHDVLQDFRDRCVVLYRDYLYAKNPDKSLELCWEIADDAIKPVPAKGSLDIGKIRQSDYFFA
jgi:DNA-directed RNA polymerase, mitochondrial